MNKPDLSEALFCSGAYENVFPPDCDCLITPVFPVLPVKCLSPRAFVCLSGTVSFSISRKHLRTVCRHVSKHDQEDGDGRRKRRRKNTFVAVKISKIYHMREERDEQSWGGGLSVHRSVPVGGW